jgi:hypothetical protein
MSVVALEAVHRAATLATAGDFKAAKEVFQAAQGLIDRCSSSDEQQEEQYIMTAETKAFVSAVCTSSAPPKKSNDAATAAVLAMRNAPLRQFQSASKKNVQNRMVSVENQERVNRFGVEAAY